MLTPRLRRATALRASRAALALTIASIPLPLHAAVSTSGDVSPIIQVPLHPTLWHMAIDDGTPNIGTLYIGLDSFGQVSVSPVASLVGPLRDPPTLGPGAFPSISIGSNFTATGILTVSGPGASVNSQGLLEVGEFGEGSLSILNGASVNAYEFSVAGQLSSEGSFSISGPGSALTVTDNFIVGNFGNATLTADDHASISAPFGVLGGAGPSTTVTISNNSSLVFSTSLIVAGQSDTDLFLQSGSSILTNDLLFGVKPAPNENAARFGGSAIVDNASITATNSFTMAQDTFNFDQLSLINGSSLTTGNLTIGLNGTAIVVLGGTSDGRLPRRDNAAKQSSLVASTITLGGGQFDAAGPQSALYVLNGSLATSGDALIAGDESLAEVSDVSPLGRSTWNAGNITVNSGDIGGGLVVAAGGLVTAPSVTIDDGFASIDGRSNGTPSTLTIAGNLFVGATSGTYPNTLSVTGGAQLQSGDAFLGDATYASRAGATTIDGLSTTWTAGNISLANGFDHALTISGGASVFSQQFFIADNSNGSLILTDPFSSLDTNNQLFVVGNLNGTGTLTIQLGAQLHSGDAFIGGFPDATGNVTLSDPFSSWSAKNLTVGNQGNGTFTIQNGANLSVSALFIGAGTSTTGNVTTPGVGNLSIDGGGVAPFSSISDSGTLVVGQSGVGSLAISNGAIVRSDTAFIGSDSGGAGTLLLTGPGSQWLINSYLTIGTYGNGTATISNGAKLSADHILVGENPGATGNLTLDNATILLPSSLDIGNAGNGTLSLRNNANLSADTLTLGSLSTGIGNASFDGNGTTATFANPLTIADQGTANLSLSNLANVSATSLLMATSANSLATVTISDFAPRPNPNDNSTPLPQSTLNITGDASVAIAGAANLTIKNGGLLKSANGFAATQGGLATISITGNNSLWDISGGTLTLGGVGHTDMNLSNGGAFKTANLTLGPIHNSSAPDATLAVAGGTPVVTATSLIGDAGSGLVSISGGLLTSAATTIGNAPTGIGIGIVSNGTWSASSLTLGQSAGALGNLTVGNSNTSLTPVVTVANAITVGNSGTGAITINNGHLAANATTIGANPGSSGLVRLLAPQAVLEVGNKLTVGGSGAGELDILLGANVDAGSVVIGTSPGNGHLLNLGGAGSQLNVFSSLTIGASGGNGDFALAGNASATANSTSVGTSSLNPASIGTGTLSVASGTLNAGKLTVVSGSQLLVANGGKVIASSATLGTGHFLSAQITITDPATTLDVSAGNITVGGFGAADFRIDNGATVLAKSIAVHPDGILQGDGGHIKAKVLNDGGTVHPGNSPGTLTIEDDYTQTDGTLDIEFAGTDPAQMDALNILGNATLAGGAIQFSFIDGYAPKAGDTLPFLTSLNIPNPSALTFQVLNVDPSFQFSITTTGNTLQLLALTNVIPTPEPTLGLLTATSSLLLLTKRRARSPYRDRPARN
ncbi:MAG: beta strand repeat-containing protein [Phycisphaerae bacterium]